MKGGFREHAGAVMRRATLQVSVFSTGMDTGFGQGVRSADCRVLHQKPLDGDPGIIVLKGMGTGPAVSPRQSTTLLLNIYYIGGNVKHNGEGHRPHSQAGWALNLALPLPPYP